MSKTTWSDILQRGMAMRKDNTCAFVQVQAYCFWNAEATCSWLCARYRVITRQPRRCRPMEQSGLSDSS